MRMRSALAAIVMLLLGGCGLRPVYGSQYQAERAQHSGVLSAITIDTGTDRLSQLFKAELQDKLNPTHASVPPRYRLSVAINEQNIPLFVAPDGTFGRGNMQYQLRYSLIALHNNANLSTDTLTRVSSYAASEQDAIYASYVTQQDARKRGMVALADDMALRLGNLLGRAPVATDTTLPAVKPGLTEAQPMLIDPLNPNIVVPSAPINR